ncbi:MAG: MotA/TolQ/ExbB proton channel family protein [Oscillospiraceae bacterium]
MDFSLVIGIVIGMAMILGGFTLEHGVIASLIQLSPAMIVIGGTIGAVFASFSTADIVKAFKALKGSFSKSARGNPQMVIAKLCEISDKCRKEGILSLEASLDDPDLKKDDYLFLKEGLILVLDGKSEEELANTLESDIKAFVVHKQLEIAVFEGAGGFSPTMGVLGTVMSLVNVLAHMGNDPTALAESIASAFIATLYGVGLANIVWLPIASKLKSNLKRLKLQREMILDGICMIARGEPSRNVENKLSLYWQAFPGGAKKYKAGIEN